MKYSLSTKEIPRAESKGFSEGSGYISLYIPPLVIIQIQYLYGSGRCPFTKVELPCSRPRWNIFNLQLLEDHTNSLEAVEAVKVVLLRFEPV